MRPTDRHLTGCLNAAMPDVRNMQGFVQAVQAPVQALVQALVQGSEAPFSQVNGLFVQAVQGSHAHVTHDAPATCGHTLRTSRAARITRDPTHPAHEKNVLRNNELKRAAGVAGCAGTPAQPERRQRSAQPMGLRL